ncbi:hypothetical protein CCP3SC15_5240003 [Gammaproteobacteria bacterium]
MYLRVILGSLNPEHVLRELGDGAIMLCWENPGEFCHRNLAAAWLHNRTGVEVAEVPKPVKHVIESPQLSFF